MTSTTAPSELKIHGIVVGVDGSHPSHVAIEWAAREAALRGVPLTVVHVLPSADIDSWVDVPVPEDYLAERDRRAEQVVADAVSDAHGIVVEHRIVPGPNVPALVDISKDAEMIVVGCRGLGGVQGLLLGSVSSGLVHHSHCPVAVIHGEDLVMNQADAPVCCRHRRVAGF
jgi:nucleotide-binding universal stress UspA family protein